jgi:hypothetical protein
VSGDVQVGVRVSQEVNSGERGNRQRKREFDGKAEESTGKCRIRSQGELGRNRLGRARASSAKIQRKRARGEVPARALPTWLNVGLL